MKRSCSPQPFEKCRGIRYGVSLSEVLVSIVIMSIGVMLLSTLLPISILRTAQATQLTQAVLLRNNAEAAVESNLGILSNSQIPFPATSTNAISVIAVVDPLGRFLNIPAQPNFGGLAGLPRTTGGATSLPAAEGLAQLPDSFSTIAQGAVATSGLTATPPYITFTTATVSALNVRNSTNFGLANPPAPHRLVMFDSSGKFAVIEPLSQVISGNEFSWWDPNNTAANPGPSLPAGFVPATARIEAIQRRFTWLMTVKKRLVSTASNGSSPIDASWAAEINVAVFFNRSFNSVEETPFAISQTTKTYAGVPTLIGFDLAPGVAGVNDDADTSGPSGGYTDFTDPGTNLIPDVNEVGWLGSDDNRTITVTFTAGSPPPLKKGGFMLEPSQLKWYRIVNFTAITSASTSANVLFDQDIRVPSGGSISNGIFLKGIVDVYSLGSRTGQQ